MEADFVVVEKLKQDPCFCLHSASEHKTKTVFIFPAEQNFTTILGTFNLYVSCLSVGEPRLNRA